jgi:hypothetical protein
MNRSSVLDELEDEPPRQDTRGRWILFALVLSLAGHLAFIWWARSYDVPAFSDAYYDRIVPRAFKVDRVEIDSSLLDENAAVEAENGSVRQVEFAPPNHVSNVAESTNHGNARTFFDLRKTVRHHRHFHFEQWCANCLANQRLVAIVIWVSH